jgi:sulfonate transport system ATP-binding protein
MRTPAVRLSALTRCFAGTAVLDGIDLAIAPGEFVALLGRSGSGKTTLLKLLAGLDDGYAGTLVVPDKRAVVFQEARLLPWKTVAANVGLGLDRASQADVAKALAEVGLAHRATAWPATLSGGEAGRAALARALVREPALLLLDEPFAALDALTRLKMHGLVEGLWQVHRPAVLLVTHDVDEALLLADRVLILDNGRIITDEAVSLPRPRSNADPAFQRQRLRLLAGLGVAPPQPASAGPGLSLVTPALEAVA